jgi:DNA gyrase subunit A
VITISHMGYIKRTLLSEYRQQKRGGKGARGSNIRGEDFLEHLFVATNHNYLLFFTEKGKCFWLRVFEIPEGSKTSKGRAIQNMVNIEQNDTVRAFINVKDLSDEEYTANNYIVMGTKKGVIKKTSLAAYSRPRQNGINAININEGDMLLQARLTDGDNEIIMACKSGRAIRFHESKVRSMGRTATGVKGITLLSKKDEMIGMICLPNDESDILVVSENGYGKRSKLEDYRITNRGGKGVKTLNITDKTGKLISIHNVLDSADLIIITKAGVLIRLAVDQMRVMGRATQGVRLIKLGEKDAIASIAKVERANDEDEDDIENIGEENLESGENPETSINNDVDSVENTEDNNEENNEENTNENTDENIEE